MISRALIVMVWVGLILASCGGAETTDSRPRAVATTSSSSSTSSPTPTTDAPAATNSEFVVTTVTPVSTTLAPSLMEKVMAFYDGWYGTPSPRGDCGHEGPIEEGSVFACGGDCLTDDSVVECGGGTVFYVIDESGRAAWTSGTDVPGTTDDLIELFREAPKGLFCRDLLSPEVSAFPFDGYGRPPQSAFFWSLVYWSLERKPERIDTDRNGVPCETLFRSDTVKDVVNGGPVP